MDQKKLINLYNSIFDDSESETEIEDSVKDSHDELNIALSEKNQPELFHCILNMMDDNNYPHKRNDKLTASELLKIDKIEFREVKFETGWVNYPSYFQDFNPEDGDFSIIFKYLRNVQTLENNCFFWCKNLTKINIPDSVTKIGEFCFYGCVLIKEIYIPKSIENIEDSCFENCFKLQSIIIPKKFKNNISDIFKNVDLSKVKITYI